MHCHNSGRVYETKRLHFNQSFRESKPEAGADDNTPGKEQNKPIIPCTRVNLDVFTELVSLIPKI